MAKAAMTKTKNTDDVWQWMQGLNDKDKWSTIRIPPNEAHAPYIKQMSRNDDGSFSFYVYRDGKCLGALRHKDRDKGLAEAQKACRAGKVPGVEAARKAIAQMNEYVKNTPRDGDAFKALPELAQKVVANEFPWAMPSRRVQEDKGIKHVAVKRTDLLSQREKSASRGGKWNIEATIKMLKKGPNPKKPGTGQWQRWEILLAHGGKTVGEYLSKGGDVHGIKQGLDTGWIELVEK